MGEIREYRSINLSLVGEEPFNIKTYITSDGNILLPYYTILKYLYTNKSLVATRKIKPLVEEYFIEYQASKLVPVSFIKEIFSLTDNYERMVSIICQIYGITTPKNKFKKMPYLDKVENALEAIIKVNEVIDSTYSSIHTCDLKQCDLLHELEVVDSSNDEVMLEKCKELKKLRAKRRGFKNSYKPLNYVKTNLEKLLNNRPDFFKNTLKKFKEIRKEIEENPIYYHRSPEKSKDNLNIKIKEWKEKYK